MMHNHLDTSLDFAEQCLRMAEEENDTSLLVPAHVAMGGNFVFGGQISQAQTHLERGYEFYDSEKHHSLSFQYGTDTGVWCLAYGAWATWLLGYPIKAIEKSKNAIALAEKLSHLAIELSNAFP